MYNSDKAAKLSQYISKYGISFIARVRYIDIRKMYPIFSELNDRILLTVYGMSTSDEDIFELTSMCIDIISNINASRSITDIEFHLERYWFHSRQLQSVYLTEVEKADSGFVETYHTSCSETIENLVRPMATEIVREFILNNVY